MPTRKIETLQEATLKLLEQVNQKGREPTNKWLDNEVSEKHLSILKYQGISAQLVLIHMAIDLINKTCASESTNLLSQFLNHIYYVCRYKCD